MYFDGLTHPTYTPDFFYQEPANQILSNIEYHLRKITDEEVRKTVVNVVNYEKIPGGAK